jgi:hypothetical protein
MFCLARPIFSHSNNEGKGQLALGHDRMKIIHRSFLSCRQWLLAASDFSLAQLVSEFMWRPSPALVFQSQRVAKMVQYC